MPQLKYREDMVAGVPGQRFDNSGCRLTAFATSPQQKQIDTITVDSAVDDTDYAVEINGVAISVTSGTGATTGSVAALLAAAINAEGLVNGIVSAEASDPDVVVTGRNVALTFDISEDDGNLSLASTQSADGADPVDYGRLAVVLAENSSTRDGGGTGQEKFASLADSAQLTAKVLTATFVDENGATYHASVTVEGKTYDAEFTSSGGGEAAITAALAGSLNDVLPPDTVVAADDTADIVFTAETAGRGFEVDLGVSDGTGTAAVSLATTTQGDDINANLGGIVELSHASEKPLPGFNAGRSSYAQDQVSSPNRALSLAEDGARMYVATEAAVDLADKVWVRLTANGDNDTLGIFTNTKDTDGTVLLEGAKWFRSLSDSLAVIQMPSR